MLETQTAKSQLEGSSQEQFMSADKISNDTTDTGLERGPSALMKVANAIDTSVDSSLDAFIAEANSTLDAIGGWGISDEAPADTSIDLANAESRASAAEEHAASVERQTQAALTSAQSQLAEAEARASAAEQRAMRAEKASKNAKTNLLASAVPRASQARPAVTAPMAIPEIKPVAPAPVAAVEEIAFDAFPDTISEAKRKPKYALFAGVFIAGGLLAFGAAKFMVGNGDTKSADQPAATPAVIASPDQAEAAVTPTAPAAPEVKSLAAEPTAEALPEVVPLDTGDGEAEAGAAAALAATAEADRLAEEAASAKLEAELLAKEQAMAAQAAAEDAAAAAQVAADNAAAAAKAAADKAAAISGTATKKPAKTKKVKAAKSSKPKRSKKKPTKSKSKPKAKKKKAPAKPKGGIVDPFA